MRDILAEAILNAPVVSNFMAQVAAGMVTASAKVNPDYQEIFEQVFTRRSILSLQTRATATEQHIAAAAFRGVAAASVVVHPARGPGCALPPRLITDCPSR